MGGLTDTTALNRYSALVGEVELTRATTSYDSTTGRATSGSEQLQDRKAMRADEGRRIADGHALMLYRNQAPVLLAMTPWFKRPNGAALDADRKRVEASRMTTREVPAGTSRPGVAAP